MFKNVGKKIKGLAKVFYWIIFAVYCISALGFLGYAIIRGSETLNYDTTTGWLIIGVGVFGAAVTVGLGFLFAWLSTIFIYGFGELIDQTVEINQKLTPPQQGRPVPPPMGMHSPMAMPMQAPLAPPKQPTVPMGVCEKCKGQIARDRLTTVQTPDGVTHEVCLDCLAQMRMH